MHILLDFPKYPCYPVFSMIKRERLKTMAQTNAKLTKKEEQTFMDCQGACRICFYDGGCKLQKKLKNNGENS